MATLQSDPLTYLNGKCYFLAILLAFFFQIVTAGSAFSDGGHAGPSLSETQAPVRLPSCGPRNQALEVLRKHGEDRAGSGVTANGVLVELFVDEQDGSWTFVLSPQPGVSCFPAHGDGWKDTSGQGS